MSILSDDDMPVGLGMSLALDLKAMEHFAKLPDTEKLELINYIKSAATGYEAKDRITQVISKLHGNSMIG